MGIGQVAAGVEGSVVLGVAGLKGGADVLIGGVGGLYDNLTDLYLAMDAVDDPFAPNVLAARDALGNVPDPSLPTITGGLAGLSGGAGLLLFGLGTAPADCLAAEAQAADDIAGPLGKPSVLTALVLLQCGAEELEGGLGTAVTGVTLLNGGMSNPWAFDPTNPEVNPTCEDRANPIERCGLLQGLQLVAGGLDLLGIGLSSALSEVNAGLGSTDVPGETLLFGMGQISTGATAASTGAGALSDGLFQLDDGAVQLADGTDAASTGAEALADGLGQIEDGAGQLATGAKAASDGGSQLAAGLPDAQDGAQQIADGLALANIGGGQIADGASELGSRGTAVLADQVNEAAAGTNKLVAQLVAVDERGRTEALPYPAAEGAVATAVFQYDLAGIETTGMGESGRAIVAIGLLGAAGGLGVLGRRRLTGR
jgi:X-X-X-Leu-X-X-Gly heptad repeat protein